MPVLMGRKTFESIGKVLPGRLNIVITNNRHWSASGVSVVHSLDDAIAAGTEAGVKELFVIGGATIFQSALPQAGRVYLTRIHSAFSGDTFFTLPGEGQWTLRKEQFCGKDARNAFDHTFQVWERTPATAFVPTPI
jgi:dihydrofolate reductase